MSQPFRIHVAGPMGTLLETGAPLPVFVRARDPVAAGDMVAFDFLIDGCAVAEGQIEPEDWPSLRAIAAVRGPRPVVFAVRDLGGGSLEGVLAVRLEPADWDDSGARIEAVARAGRLRGHDPDCSMLVVLRTVRPWGERTYPDAIVAESIDMFAEALSGRAPQPERDAIEELLGASI